MNHGHIGALIALATILAIPTASATRSAAGEDIVVADTQGDATLTQRGATRALRSGLIVPLPSTVRTGKDGTAELTQGATKVSVAPDTVLEFPESSKPGAPIERVVQSGGNAFYDIAKRETRKLRVETPYLVAVVKGTQFSVTVQEDSTSISLIEGSLEIRATEGGAVVDIVAGEIATMRRGDSLIQVLRVDEVRVRAAPATTLVAAAGSGINGAVDAVASARAPVINTGVGATVAVDTNVLGTLTSSVAETRGSEGPNVAVMVAVDVAPDAGVGAGVDVGLTVETSPTGAGVVLGADAGIAAGPVGVEAAVSSSVDLGGAGVSLDTSVGAAIDVGPVVDVAATISTGVDLGAGSAGVDLALGGDVGLGGAGVSLDTTIDVGLDVAPVVDATVDVSAGVDLTADVGVDLGAGAIDLGVSAGGVDVVDLGVDLPLEDVLAPVDAVVGGIAAPVETVISTVGGALGGLLRRPGRP